MTARTTVKRFLGAGMVGIAAFGMAACSAEKPSQEDFNNHMRDLMGGVAGASSLPEEQLNSYSDCISTELYNNLDADALNEIMDLEGINDLGDFSEDDQAAADAAADKCVSEMTGATAGN